MERVEVAAIGVALLVVVVVLLDLMYITYAFPLRLDPHAAGAAALPLVSSVVLIARSPCAGAAR